MLLWIFRECLWRPDLRAVFTKLRELDLNFLFLLRGPIWNPMKIAMNEWDFWVKSILFEDKVQTIY